MWSPDGKYLWYPANTLLTSEGKVIARLPDLSPWAVWNREGTQLIVSGQPGTRTLRSVTLDGKIQAFALPDWGIPVAFLPDGRVLVYKTIVPN